MMRIATIALISAAVPTALHGQAGAVRHLNPPELPTNPAYSQAVVVSGSGTTVYVSGQNAVDAEGHIVGEGDVGAQTIQALANLERALAAAGARLDNVVKWQVLVVEGAQLEKGFEAFEQVWARRGPAPALTVAVVRSLWHPAILVEIDAIAVVPHQPVTGPR